MRRLVNNWLYGEVSQLLSGRLDSEIYGNSCSELTNMKVHRQGGISRRPPLKKKLVAQGYKRMIPFIVDRTHVYAVLLGAGTINIYDYVNNVLINGLSLPTHTVAIHSWANISASQCKEVKYAQYYNDLYLVHPNFPLMRVRYAAGFIVSTPQIYVNQDIHPKAITLTIAIVGAAQEEALSFTFDGQSHSFTQTATSQAETIIANLKNFTYTGWDVTSSGSVITFTPQKTINKYRDYDFESDYFKLVRSDGDSPHAFTATWGTTELSSDELGLVYGSDDFTNFYLNREDDLGNYHFASDIAIISERMFLTVNGNPCNVYASRPYGVSQIIYPKRSNDSILDFIQFEMVTTDNTVMKEEADLPVEIVKDTNNEIVYEGVSTDQKLWLIPASYEITTKKSLDEYRKGKYVNGVFEPYSAHELVVEHDTTHRNIVNKIKKITTTATTEEDFIERADVYYNTYDEHVDTSKLQYNKTTREYSTNKYFVYNGTNYVLASATNTGLGGLKYVYSLTGDTWLNPAKAYYTRSGSGTAQDPYVYSFVEEPQYSSIESYYEKTVDFTDLDNIPIYEFGPQYIYSESGDILKVQYLDNGMIEVLSDDNGEIVKAIPYYQFDMSTESSIYEESVEVDRVATASTGIEFQLSTGRNDRIAWMRLGDYIMIGTESAEWRVDPSINALKTGAVMYSSFGSKNGLSTNLSTDVIFLQRGNGLRLFYKDYYGLQNVELTLTNPEIMNGDIKEIMGMVTPEPALFVLKEDGTVINLCVDRTNGVQAFSRWTFAEEKPISLCVMENDSRQVLIALMADEDNTFIAEFDTTEALHFIDCGFSYRHTEDTTIVQGKKYYNELHVEVTPVSNPKAEGLLEYGLFDNEVFYVSRMIANPFDTQTQDGSVTIGEAKNVSKMIFRCLDTGHVITYFNEKDKTKTRVPICCNKSGQYIGGLADHSVNVNGGTTRDLLIAVESVEDEPMTMLAMAYELRLNKNAV